MLANEFGAGRGHLVTLARLAQAFGPGVEIDAALCRRTHEDELIRIGAITFDGPMLAYDNSRRYGPGAVHTATWGEFLGDLGFASIPRLTEIVAWWRHVLVSRRIGLVMADYAPLALLAARSLDIPTVATGTGYGLPPSEMAEFPVLMDEYQDRLHDEAALLRNVNTVAEDIGLPPLAGLPQVYQADLPLVRTLPMLDPYAECRKTPYLPPIADISPTLGGGGDEVFVYFSTEELKDPAVVEALTRLPLPRRAYLPAPPDGVAERLVASGMILEPAPVPVEEIARRSRLVLNAGQHGILCLALFAGLPQVALPQHLEQLYHARRAEAAGLCHVIALGQRGADDMIAAIMAAYHSDPMATAAQMMAKTLRATLSDDPQEITRRALVPLRNRVFGLIP